MSNEKPIDKLSDIFYNYLNERTVFNIKIALNRGHDDALIEVFKKFSDELKKNNLFVDEIAVRKRFEELGEVGLFDKNADKIRPFLKQKTDYSEEESKGDYYKDLTPKARGILFRFLNDGNIESYSEEARSDPETFKKVFVTLIKELKERNEKITGLHLISRMIESGADPAYWNDQLNSIASLIEDLEGKKAQPFFDQELQDLANEVSKNLPQEVSKEKMEESQRMQKLNIQEDRFIKMHLNLSTQLRGFEGHILNSALEKEKKEEELKTLQKLLTSGGDSEKRRLEKLNNMIEVEKNFKTFLQEIATIDEIDHDKVSIIPVEGEVEGRKFSFPAIRVPFKNDFKSLKRIFSDKVYSSKLTPYFTNETEGGITIRNTDLEKEAVFDSKGLTINLDIEPGRRFARHTERLGIFKRLMHPEK